MSIGFPSILRISNGFNPFQLVCYWILSFLELFLRFPSMSHWFPLISHSFYEVPPILMDFKRSLLNFIDFTAFYLFSLWVPIYFHWFSIDFKDFERFWCILIGFLLDFIDFTPFYPFSINVPFIPIAFPLILRISNGFNAS